MQLQASPILNFWTCKSSKRFLFPKFIVSKTRIESRRIAFQRANICQRLKNQPKWQNFAKSDHTVSDSASQKFWFESSNFSPYTLLLLTTLKNLNARVTHRITKHHFLEQTLTSTIKTKEVLKFVFFIVSIPFDRFSVEKRISIFLC